MKLRSITLREVARLRDETTIGSFGDGINLLIAPNEFGKSTVLRALRTAFTTSHASSQQALVQLRPYGGGSPYVRVAFDYDGTPMALEKQYLSGKSAVLTNVATGDVVGRGRDAEEAFERLVAKPVFGGRDASRDRASGPESASALNNARDRFGLLWLETPSELDPGTLSEKEGRELVHSAIEARASEVSGGAELSQLRKAVKKSLDVHCTGRKRGPKKNGPWDLARQRLDEAQERYHEASATARRISDTVQRLQLAQVSLREIDASLSGGALQARLDAVQAALRSAEETVGSLEHQRAAVKTAENAKALATTRRTALQKRQTDYDALSSQREGVMRELGELDKKIATESAKVATLDKQLQAGRTRLHQARADERVAGLLGERSRLEREGADLRDKLSRFDALHGRRAAAEVKRDANPVTAEQLEHVRSLDEACRSGARALKSGQAEIAFALEAGAVDRIRVNGEPVDVAGALTVDQPLVVEIKGVGQFTVSPSQFVGGEEAGQQRRDAEAHLAKLTAELSSALSELGAASFGEAVTLSKARYELEQEIAQVERECAHLAPDGRDGLSARLKDLAEQVAAIAEVLAAARMAATPGLGDEVLSAGAANDVGGDVQPDLWSVASTGVGDLSARMQETAPDVEALESAMMRLEEETGDLREAVEALKVQRAGLQSTVDQAIEQQERMEAESGPVSGWSAELSAAIVAADEAQQAYEAAAAALAGLERQAPGADALRDLRADVAAAQSALREAETAKRAYEATVSECRTVLREREAERIDDAVEEAAEALERAQRAKHALDKEVAELKMLEAVLEEVSQDQSARLTRPIAERMHPYIEKLFPGARLGFGEDLSLDTVQRGDVTEKIDALSDGTKEQMALLSRLAFADLLADEGYPTPIILDDPLQRTDDARLERMFRILHEASKRHQIIILSCRQAAFAGLEGTRLTLRDGAHSKRSARLVVAAE